MASAYDVSAIASAAMRFAKVQPGGWRQMDYWRQTLSEARRESIPQRFYIYRVGGE